MSDNTDETDDTEREKYGIVGGKATVDEVREKTDDDDSEDTDE